MHSQTFVIMVFALQITYLDHRTVPQERLCHTFLHAKIFEILTQILNILTIIGCQVDKLLFIFKSTLIFGRYQFRQDRIIDLSLYHLWHSLLNVLLFTSLPHLYYGSKAQLKEYHVSVYEQKNNLQHIYTYSIYNMPSRL